MFFDAVWSGMKVLFHWETYVAAILYFLATIGPYIPSAFAREDGSAKAVLAVLGFLSSFVIHPLALLFVVMTLSPIILGVSDDAAWTLPWILITHAPLQILKVAGTILIISFILAFIPILGQMRSLSTLISGGISLALVVGIISSLTPVKFISSIDFFPGFWFVIGILLVSAIITWVGLFIPGLISAFGRNGEMYFEMLAMPLVGLFGLIPVFIYGGWLGQQVRLFLQ